MSAPDDTPPHVCDESCGVIPGDCPCWTTPAAEPAQPAEAGTEERLLPGLRAELHAITERYARANAALIGAQTATDRDAAELARWSAAGEYDAASLALADTLLMLLRHGLRQRPELLRTYLMDALRAELEPITEALARLENRDEKPAGRSPGEGAA
jgi:hypothetical protein